MEKGREHSLIREGVAAGVIGATAVALWFLLLDTLQGVPLQTPAVLGGALLSVLGPPFDDSSAVKIVGYTAFHYAAFVAVGTLLVAVIHRSRSEPSVLAGLLLLFVAFEAGFYALTALLLEPAIGGNLGWMQVGVGNLLAAGSMGVYLWRTHPLLGEDFVHALSGRE